MANKYYNVDKSPYYPNKYFLIATEEVHKNFINAPKAGTYGYQMVIISLFGLKPSDFFKYIQIEFNAKIIKAKDCIWKSIAFDNLADAWKFAKECDHRFSYCVENKFFEAE